MYPEFIHRLKTQLTFSLPGEKAHRLMAPYRRLIYDFPDISALNPKRGCVLILIYPLSSGFSIVYIKRTKYIGVHSGQISFPGGKFEPADITFENAALRESEEEIGVDASEIRIIGKLSELYIPPSNFLVNPFVGFIPYRPEFIIDKREVDVLIEVKLDVLLKASENIITHQINTSDDIAITTPCYEIHGNQVWGATAMITCEFIEILKKIPDCA